MTPDARQFCGALDALINRYRSEADLDYTDVIAALEFAKFSLLTEVKVNAIRQTDDEQPGDYGLGDD